MSAGRSAVGASLEIDSMDARRLLMHGAGLLEEPDRRSGPATVARLVQRLGFVQLDTINVVARAHDHVLWSRLDNYRPGHLSTVLERDRRLFEHWTHDASIIPLGWLPYWRCRFDRYRRSLKVHRWWSQRLGPDPQRLVDDVLTRIRDEGPCMSRDFEHDRDGAPSSWWGWKPAKSALEYLWRVGDLAVDRRINFHKVYDLATRVYAGFDGAEIPDDADHLHWACTAALERLGVATPAEIAAFLRAVPLPEVRVWCQDAEAGGLVIPVVVIDDTNGAPRRAFALPDIERRIDGLPETPRRMRLLSPFDPVLRDRARAARLFGFEYRFEAFVPAARRRYGYYVLPLLDGDELVGRLDAKLHRDEAELEIRGLWWEPDMRVTRARKARLREAVDRFAGQLGAGAGRLP